MFRRIEGSEIPFNGSARLARTFPLTLKALHEADLESGFDVLDARRALAKRHARRIEPQALDALVVSVTPLPESLPRATDAPAFLRVDTAETRGPSVRSSGPDFDDDDHAAVACDKVELECAKAKIPCNQLIPELQNVRFDEILGLGSANLRVFGRHFCPRLHGARRRERALNEKWARRSTGPIFRVSSPKDSDSVRGVVTFVAAVRAVLRAGGGASARVERGIVLDAIGAC